MSEAKRPTVREIDRLGARLEALAKAQQPTAKQQWAAEKAVELRKQALAMTLEFGEVPEGAPQSKRLAGTAVEFMAIGGKTRTDDQGAIGRLREALAKAGHGALFALMFTPRTIFDRAKGAETNFQLITENLPKPLRRPLEALFAETLVEKSKAAWLKIEPVKE